MKAMIISHEAGGSYVMDHDGCFHFVKGHTAKPIGAEIELTQKVPFSHSKFASIAACFLLVVFIGGFAWLWSAECYSVYAEINPSVELIFNNFSSLKEAKALNEDGAALLAQVKLKGGPDKVVLNLLDAAERQGYLTPNGDLPAVLLMVVGKDDRFSREYQRMIDVALAETPLAAQVEIEVCDLDFRAKAVNLGVSPGKLKLAERLFSQDQTVSLEEIVKMPVKDLMTEIRTVEGKGVPAEGNGQAPEPVEPNDAPEGNSGNAASGNPNAGPGNNSGVGAPSNPNAGPGNNSGVGEPSNPNAGPGNNSGGGEPSNPNAGPGNNSGNDKPSNPNAGSGNNSGQGGVDNPNAGAGNNSGKDASGNANAGSGSNSGNNGNKKNE